MVLIFRGGDLPNGGRQTMVSHEKTLSAPEIKPRSPPCRIGKKQDLTIARTYQFKDFPAAIKFVNAVAKLAEQAWHHPDIDIRWNG